jgi:hypothetical protein
MSKERATHERDCVSKGGCEGMGLMYSNHNHITFQEYSLKVTQLPPRPITFSKLWNGWIHVTVKIKGTIDSTSRDIHDVT